MISNRASVRRKHSNAPGRRPRAPLTAIKRVCLFALTILLATGAVATAIALKTAIYFWRFKVGAG
jgi:hypothetical protein